MTADRLFLSPPHMSGAEMDFIKEAFASNYIAPLGPMVEAFERDFSEYIGLPYCVAVSSGTAATHLVLRHLVDSSRNPGKGRPVVLASTLTFIGSVTPAVFERCELRFIDCDRETWNMDPALLEEELAVCAKEGRWVMAVIPTDIYGQCCNLQLIRSLCDRFGVPVICDSAEAVGARYRESGDRGQGLGVTNPEPSSSWRHAGFDAWAAVYSFNGNKIITTSGGGMLASRDKALIDHARKLATQARDPAPHYEHTEIGYNYRMSSIVAAIGRGQMRVLDERVRRRREIFERYRELLGDLPGITFMPEADYNRATHWLTVVQIEAEKFGATPDEIRAALEQENIEARPVWKPMHLQPVFAECRVRGGAVSERLFKRGLCLPSGSAMTEKDIERVVAGIKKYLS